MGAISELITTLIPGLGALALPILLFGVFTVVLVAAILIRVLVINKIRKAATNTIKGAIKNSKAKKAAKAEKAAETATEEKAE
jgi:hypothetical protein